MTLVDDVRILQAEVASSTAEREALKGEIALLKEQMLGERGLSATLKEQTAEIKGLRKAAYWVAGLIVAGSISFGFSVLVLIG